MKEKIGERIKILEQKAATKKEKIRYLTKTNASDMWKTAEVRFRELILMNEQIETLKGLLYGGRK